MYRSIHIPREFDAWREAARELLANDVPPGEVMWSDATQGAAGATGGLFAPPTPPMPPTRPTLAGPAGESDARAGVTFGGAPSARATSVDAVDVARLDATSVDAAQVDATQVDATGSIGASAVGAVLVSPARVPRGFVDLARVVACHRDPARWGLLYRVLHRITHGEPALLSIAIDDDTHALQQMEKSVRRDRHKMTAFVRFRKIVDDDGQDAYVAWHRPDHYIVRLVAPFFVDRFRSMRWAILTPDDSMSWDGSTLHFGQGIAADPMAGGDEMESLWTTYYAHIFNPARIKLNAMRAEMPKKHWATMPETKLIPQMLRDAPARVARMIQHTANIRESSAADFVPQTTELPVLRAAAAGCRGCDLCERATQTVFGQGPADAKVVFVGEQPGDEEDTRGQPFVGPAGRLLDEVLVDVGIDRSVCYVTNSVKHFKFEQRGKRRIHAKPSAREINACRPWLSAELAIIKPKVLVLLGATAAQTVLGRQFRVSQSRGAWVESDYARQTIATIHPSAILRAPDPAARQRSRDAFADDLRLVSTAIQKLSA